MVHCGMWYWCIVGFVQQVYCNPFPVQCNCKRSFWVWTDWTQPMRLRDSNFVILSSTAWAYTQNAPHNHSRYMDLVKWQTVLLKTISHLYLAGAIPRMITAINLLLSFHHIVYMTKGVQSMISQANTSGRSTGLTGNWQVTEIPLPPIIFDTEDNEVELFSTVVIVMMPYAAS